MTCHCPATGLQNATQLCPLPLTLPLQASHLYPHIATRDAAECVNATWLRTLNEGIYKFRWGLPLRCACWARCACRG